MNYMVKEGKERGGGEEKQRKERGWRRGKGWFRERKGKEGERERKRDIRGTSMIS